MNVVQGMECRPEISCITSGNSVVHCGGDGGSGRCLPDNIPFELYVQPDAELTSDFPHWLSCTGDFHASVFLF